MNIFNLNSKINPKTVVLIILLCAIGIPLFLLGSIGLSEFKFGIVTVFIILFYVVSVGALILFILNLESLQNKYKKQNTETKVKYKKINFFIFLLSAIILIYNLFKLYTDMGA